jgi:uncharacterized protein (DUF1800 family)
MARRQVAWLHRRAGVGLAPGELDVAAARGVEAELERLLEPDRAGIPADPDPWAGTSYLTDGRPEVLATSGRQQQIHHEITDAVDRWLDAMVGARRPLAARATWFWHGHFATSVQRVKAAGLMVGQLRQFIRGGLGRFPDLLRTTTIDPAMLIWLDGRASTAKEPNENYAREMLELFSLGIGNYQETDIRAGARALSGWTVLPDGATRFVAQRHDDTPQTYLGHNGVHDLDTVIAAVAASPALPTFLAERWTGALLGDGVDRSVPSSAAADFLTAGLDMNALVRSLLTRGVEDIDRWPPVVVDPVTWWVQARRATGATSPKLRGVAVATLLLAAGQYPMLPPNVGGWPGGDSWLATATIAARFQLAGLLAEATPANAPPRAAASHRDWAALADSLGRPEGFGAPTIAALEAAAKPGANQAPAVAGLTIALASPELAVA